MNRQLQREDNRAYARSLKKATQLQDKAVALRDKGKFEASLRVFNQASSALPDDPAIPFNRAFVLFQLGRYEDALADYELSLLQGRVLDAGILNNRGFTRLCLGRFKEALEDFNMALALDQQDLDLLANRGYALARLGRHRDAIADFDEVMAARPDDPGLPKWRAWCLSLID